MAGNYVKYAGPLNWNDLPVDAHELVALCAPRPVFIGAGATNGDGWVDAKGMFLAGVGAGPVYKLLGKRDLGTAEFPQIETALIEGDIAFRQHSGGHTPGPNYPAFLTFAERYFETFAEQAHGALIYRWAARRPLTIGLACSQAVVLIATTVPFHLTRTRRQSRAFSANAIS